MAAELPDFTYRYNFRFALGVIITGLAAGLAGMLLSLLLHGVQHIAFGYGPDKLHAAKSFLQGVSEAPPLRRLIALTVCGIIAGIGWWLLFTRGRKLVSISKAVKTPPHFMPVKETLMHGLLQIVTVGLGSPLGREVAPREVGASLAGKIARRLQIADADTAILVACGAGAGLAAVYNVPLAGAIFTLEVLLKDFSWRNLIPALFTSCIAALTAWIALGNVHQYVSPSFAITPQLLAWAVVIGPVMGAAAYFFCIVTNKAKAKAPKTASIIPLCLGNFILIGLLSMAFPALLGNGKGPIQLSLAELLTPATAAVLLLLRFGVTVTSLRAGAAGGLLTPGIMHGALLAIALSGIWNLFFPAIPSSRLALVGGTAFLASSMKMPLTALILVCELTFVGYDILFPAGLAVCGSLFCFQAIDAVVRARAPR